MNRAALALLPGLILLVITCASAGAEGERGFTVTTGGVGLPIGPGGSLISLLNPPKPPPDEVRAGRICALK